MAEQLPRILSDGTLMTLAHLSIAEESFAAASFARRATPVGHCTC